jgi:hypothetical protein
VALLAVAMVAPSATSGASPTRDWSRKVPGWPIAVGTNARGETAVAGSTRDANGIVVTVHGPEGTKRWIATWRPAKGTAYPSAVAIADGGAVFVGGSRTVRGMGIRSWWFLRRYSPEGRLVWHREQAEHPVERWGGVEDLVVTDGGPIAALSDTGCCDVSAGQEGWVTAFDGAGRARWTSPFEAAGIPATTPDLATGLHATNGGGVYVGGYVAEGTAAEPWKDREAVVVRLTARGTVAWTRVLRDAGIQDDMDVVRAVTVAGGSPVAVIEMNAVASAWTRLVRLDPTDGDVRWSGGVNGWPLTAAGTPAGDVYLLTRYPSYQVRKIGPLGGVRWTMTIARAQFMDLTLARRGMSVVGDRDEQGRLWRFAI